MRRAPRSASLPAWVLACVTGLCGGLAQAATLGAGLAAELAVRSPQDEIAIIVVLGDRVDPRAYTVGDRRQRDNRLVRALQAQAAATQGPHRVYMQNQGARRLRELWAINGIAATVRAGVVRQLAARPGIERIGLDARVQAPATGISADGSPEWNLDAVRVTELWSRGFTGTGMVVANMDTGVDAAHPELGARWRGGANSWYDPHGQHALPFDPSGHGTQTMGLLVGGAAGGSAIGLAPDARWIAAKLYNDAGQASYSDIHLAFQWLLDPDGDPQTMDAPDVVNASWGLVGTAGQCLTEFSTDLQVLRAAGIAIAFAGGNDGPAPLTSLSPANDALAFSAGAVGESQAIAGFSSRGPSACDASIYPDMVAPGAAVRTTDLSFGGLPQYLTVSGTSFAAPHVAGAMALLAQAFPAAMPARLEAALIAGARDLGDAGDDNTYGAGLLDVKGAYDDLLADVNHAPEITSTPGTSAMAGSVYRYAVVASDADGDALAYALDLAPAGMAVDAAGVLLWTPSGEQGGTTHAVSLRVADGRGSSVTQSWTIAVAAANRAPVAKADSATAAVRKTTAYTPVTIVVLANDSDADGDLDPAGVAIVLPPGKGGTAVARPDGTVAYTPAVRYRGKETFEYTVRDRAGAVSNRATVTVTVK